jgi:hypothetical protein
MPGVLPSEPSSLPVRSEVGPGACQHHDGARTPLAVPGQLSLGPPTPAKSYAGTPDLDRPRGQLAQSLSDASASGRGQMRALLTEAASTRSYLPLRRCVMVTGSR